MLDSSRFDQHGVLSGLTSTFESGLELSFASGYDQDREVSLRCSTNHVRNKTFVTGCIEDGKVLLFCLKETASNFDRFAFLALYNREKINSRLNFLLMPLVPFPTATSAICNSCQIRLMHTFVKGFEKNNQL